CFGDAFPLTFWESFIKDGILLFFFSIIFTCRERVKFLVSNSSASGSISVLVVLVSFGICMYTVYFLPFIDFLPYKEGNNIPELRVMHEGKEGDRYAYTYEIKHKQTQEIKKVTDEEYMAGIWEDDNWEIIGEPTSQLIEKGY